MADVITADESIKYLRYVVIIKSPLFLNIEGFN